MIFAASHSDIPRRDAKIPAMNVLRNYVLPDDFIEQFEKRFKVKFGDAPQFMRNAYFEELFPGISPKEYISMIDGQIRALDAKRSEILLRKDQIDQAQSVVEDINVWADGTLVFERPSAPVSHHLRQDLLARKVVSLSALTGTDDRFDFEKEIFQQANYFIVQHDWAKAFSGATDYSGGEFHLPFEVCVFEFRISGKKVVVPAFEVDGQIHLSAITLSVGGWYLPGFVARLSDGRWDITGQYDADQYAKVIYFVGEQIKAICVALEAQVADTNIVGIPERLNKARERAGKAPLADHHVIYLAHRHQHQGAATSTGVVTRRRLHFRRGHWRHYSAEHKVWVRWTLVGDPDLGFVEKEYRL